MTLERFRDATSTLLPSATAGDNYIVDHRDGTLYEFTVWANARAVACDRRLVRGDRDYPATYVRACSPAFAFRTLHFARIP